MNQQRVYDLILRFFLRCEVYTAYAHRIMGKIKVRGNNRIHANLMDRKAWRVNGLKPYSRTFWFKPIRKIHQFLFLNQVSNSSTS